MSRLVWSRLKLTEYEYKAVYKTGKINANADALWKNPITVLPLKISEKTDSKEALLLHRFLCNRFLKDGTATDSGPKETQPDINIQPAKTNNDTENKHDESSLEDSVNSDMEVRAIDSRFSFTEGLQEIDT